MIRGIGIHTPAVGSEKISIALRDLGAESVRDEITWDSVERRLGVFTKPAYFDARLRTMRAVGDNNVTILCYGNAARGIGQPYTQAEREQFLIYVRHILPFFAGIVKYVEVWNEWNTGAGRSAAQTASGQYGGADEYVALCAAVAPVIREILPGVTVLGGVTAGIARVYQESLVSAGIMQHVDGMSCHPYLLGTPERCANNLDVTQAGLSARNGGQPVPMYLTEMGWPTHTTGYDASTVAGYLSRLYRLCEQRDFVKGVWWYDLLDDGTDGSNQEFRFGLLASDGVTPKPAYHAYRALTHRAKREEWGWVEVGVTAAVETLINGRNSSVPQRLLRGLGNLKSTGTTKTVDRVPLRLMRGPVLLSVLDEIGERFGVDFEITQGPVFQGVTPAQTTVTRDSTWPNGWR